MTTQLDDGRVQCDQCGRDFKNIGNHWSNGSTCDHPELPDVWEEALVGSLMGDGCVQGKSRKNQRLQVQWASKEQCQWLNDIFGWFTTGVSLHITAEENAKVKRESGFRPNAKAENYSDQYVVRTRSHPAVTKLTSWYSSGEKVWPKDLELTPTTLLLWFVGDGHYDDKNGQKRIRIGMSNERENKEKVENYFTEQDLPSPSRWHEYESKSGRWDCETAWNVKESKQLFDYMAQSPLYGPTPWGFEYKFPEEYDGTGKSMSDVAISPTPHQ